MHQVKNQPLLKFAWDVQNLIQTIESNNPDPGPMRSVWDTICMAMKQVNEPQVIVQVSVRSGPSHGFSDIFVRRSLPHSKKHTFQRRNLFEGRICFWLLTNHQLFTL